MNKEDLEAIEILKLNPTIIAELDGKMFSRMCETEGCSIPELKDWAVNQLLKLVEKQEERIKKLDLAFTYVLQDLEVEKKGYSIEEMKQAYLSRTNDNTMFIKE